MEKVTDKETELELAIIKARIAFRSAIFAKILSKDEKAPNYFGNYMYMGRGFKNEDIFKHIKTGEYIYF